MKIEFPKTYPKIKSILMTSLLGGMITAIPIMSHAELSPPPVLTEQGCKFGDTKSFSGRLVFTLQHNKTRSIFSSDPASRTVYRTIADGHDNFSPSISPSGKKIAFLSNREGGLQLYVSDWNGANIQKVTKSVGKKGSPSWDKNETTLYYSSEIEGDNQERKSNIYSVNIENSKETLITSFNQRNLTPVINPKNDYVTYSTNRIWPGWDICGFNRQTKKELCFLSGSKSYLKPRFSKSGNLITFTQSTGPDSEVAVLDLDKVGSAPIAVTSSGHSVDPIFGPFDSLLYATSDSADGRYEIVNSAVPLHEMENFKAVGVVISCKESVKEPSWSEITYSSLSEQNLTSQFKVLKTVGNDPTPTNFKPPYLKE